MNHYPIVISWSEEDGVCVADVPDLRSCSTFADSPEETLREVQTALELRQEAAREHGVALPEPSRVVPIVWHAT